MIKHKLEFNDSDPISVKKLNIVFSVKCDALKTIYLVSNLAQVWIDCETLDRIL